MRKPTFQTILLRGIFAAFLISGQTAFADPNLVSYWTFYEGSGTIAHDSVGSNNGTVTGAAWFNDPCYGICLNFDGSDDYVDCGNGASLTMGTSQWTAAAWFKISDRTQYKGILSTWNGGGTSDSYRIVVYDASTVGGARDKVSFVIYDGSARYSVTSTTTVTDDKWHYVVGVRDSANIRIYIDGNVENSTSIPSSANISNSANLFLGRGHSSDWDFNGKIDDVRLYNRALSAGEVGQLYQDGILININKAYVPCPANGAMGVDPNVVLNWVPGKDTASHDVYFGTDYNDVNNANTSSVEYKGNFDVNSWDPCGLEPVTTYYWRIDEVNEPNLWKGHVWSFETLRPAIGLSVTEFHFTALAGGENPDDQILGISNSGVETLNWHISEDCNWLSVEPNSGSSTGEIDNVNLSVDTSGLSWGFYDCNLSVWDSNAANSPRTVHIELRLYTEEAVDFGDAPDTYGTTLANNGARHIPVGPTLGATIDPEPDGLPSVGAVLDDTTNTGSADDEDGVAITTLISPGSVTVNVSAACVLNAWMDFNGDGDFDDVGEQVFTNTALTAGNSALAVAVPAGAKQSRIYSRWRVNTAGGLSYTGPAADGEVEDHATECLKPTDPGYTAWKNIWGMPRCWCCRKQCRGDTNCASAFGKPVSGTDLDLFKSLAFNKTDVQLLLIPNGICADFNHQSSFGKRVTGADLDILKAFFNLPEASVPECPSTHINFWTN
jgi:hypothetical protein